MSSNGNNPCCYYYTCAACGKQKSAQSGFSKRQRKRAEMGQSDNARCTACVADDIQAVGAAAMMIPNTVSVIVATTTTTTRKLDMEKSGAASAAAAANKTVATAGGVELSMKPKKVAKKNETKGKTAPKPKKPVSKQEKANGEALKVLPTSNFDEDSISAPSSKSGSSSSSTSSSSSSSSSGSGSSSTSGSSSSRSISDSSGCSSKNPAATTAPIHDATTTVPASLVAATTAKPAAGTAAATPAKKRRRASAVKTKGMRNLYDDDDDSDHDDDSDDDDDDYGTNRKKPAKNFVSLEALKQKIMGRKLIASSATDDADDDNDNDGDLNVSYYTTATATSTTTALAEIPADLRNELCCAICHEVLFQPVSLLCGHSFCAGCVKWWLNHHHHHHHHHHNRQQQQQQQRPQAVQQYGNCPTCRQTVVVVVAAAAAAGGGVDPANSLRVNTALRACVAALLGDELAGRTRAEAAARRRATAGENGGAHRRGYEVVSHVDDNDNNNNTSNNNNSAAWVTVRGKTKTHGAVTARRSIVLDDQDQRMQLALALKANANWPVIRWEGDNHSIMEISLCLLTMEEDEVADSGFPFIVNSQDDEHLLTTEERFYGAIDVSAVVVANNERGAPAPSYSNVPVARRVLGSDGVVMFRIDTAAADIRTAVKFCFRHEETGTELHIRVPSRKGDLGLNDAVDGSVDLDESADIVGNTDHVVEEQYEEDSELDEFEEDGFVVGSEVDEEADDNDVCFLCHDGGEMIVCDGGDHLAGCGCPFHLACIKRDIIPPGDWVCQGCANTIGLEVGIEGHEFAAVLSSDHDKIEMSRASGGRLKRLQKADPSDTDSSDEGDFGRGSFSPEVKGEEEKGYSSGSEDSLDKKGLDRGSCSPAVKGDDGSPADDDNRSSDNELPQKVAPKRKAKRQRLVIDSDDDDDGIFAASSPSNNEDEKNGDAKGYLKRRLQKAEPADEEDSSDEVDFGGGNLSSEVEGEKEDCYSSSGEDSLDVKGLARGSFSPEVKGNNGSQADDDNSSSDDEPPQKVAPSRKAKRHRLIIDSGNDDDAIFAVSAPSAELRKAP